MFMDATNEKMNAPVQVSFLNVRAFVQDVEVNSRYAHLFLRFRPIFQDLFPFRKSHCAVFPNLL